MNNPGLCVVALGSFIFLCPAALHASNADFQDFFFDVCQNGGAQGTLNVRCQETQGGLGDLSGDSESSLNPTQTLSNNDTAIGLARKQAKENRERFEKYSGGQAGLDDSKIDIGPFSLLLNGRYIDFERNQGAQDDLERGFDGDGWGGDLGIEYRVSDSFVIGTVLGYFDTDATFDRENDGTNFFAAANAGSMDSDGWTITLFGSTNIGTNAYLDISGGYGQSDYTLGRNSVFQESGRSGQTNVVTRADTDGEQLWASLSGGYTFNFDALNIGVYAGVIWARSEIDGYTEQDVLNTGLNMRVADNDLKSMLSQVGITTNYTFSTSWGVVVPQFRVEYDREYEEDAPSVLTSYVFDTSQGSYGVEGFKRDQDFFDIGISLVAVLPDGWSAFIDYSTLQSYDDLERDTLTLGLRIEL